MLSKLTFKLVLMLGVVGDSPDGDQARFQLPNTTLEAYALLYFVLTKYEHVTFDVTFRTS
ncbi:hypothetical protein HanPI659440_Chr03g0135271 [Helianthus annuus]|nr:hypothetical protein HanPI659440_Chr03g0135271 [Helianthus annuus]